MSLKSLLILVACPIGIALGQVMFKLGASSLQKDNFLRLVLSIVLNPWFIGALVLYFSVSILWVYILQKITLVKAYPFMALAFIFVPIFGLFLLGEQLSFRYLIGVVLIILGLVLTAF